MSHNVDFNFTAQSRTIMGKRPVRRLRKTSKLPGIIYGGNEAPTPIVLEHKDVQKALSNEAVYSHILTLKLDNQNPQKVVLKAVERHPYKPQIMHIDFQRIRADEKITMRVPIHFLHEDTSPGLKQGGIVSHLMSDLEIKCLPADLPEYIAVDVANLELDHSIHLMEVALPKGVELTQEVNEAHNPTVVSIHRPRVETETEATAPAEAAAEPETTEETPEKE